MRGGFIFWEVCFSSPPLSFLLLHMNQLSSGLIDQHAGLGLGMAMGPGPTTVRGEIQLQIAS